MSYCGVYSIENAVTGRIYIGQTNKPFTRRWKQHRSQLRKGNHPNLDLQSDWITFGESAFEFCILEVVDIYSKNGCLRRAEKRHIDAASVPLYNNFKPTGLWEQVEYVPPQR